VDKQVKYEIQLLEELKKAYEGHGSEVRVKVRSLAFITIVFLIVVVLLHVFDIFSVRIQLILALVAGLSAGFVIAVGNAFRGSELSTKYIDIDKVKKRLSELYLK